MVPAIHLLFSSLCDVYLSPVSLLFLLLLIKGGGSLNLSTLRANDLQEASPPTKSLEKERHRKRERGESVSAYKCLCLKVCLWVCDAAHDLWENVSLG